MLLQAPQKPPYIQTSHPYQTFYPRLLHELNQEFHPSTRLEIENQPPPIRHLEESDVAVVAMVRAADGVGVCPHDCGLVRVG